MKFNLANIDESNRAFEYLTELNGRECLAEIKRVSPVRSLNQNNYLHLLLSAFGAEFGYTLDEAKTVYKREINPSIYIYEKNGQKFLRSSSELSTEDMTKSIDRLRERSAEMGFPLPTATDQDWLIQIENQAERSRAYL